MLQLDDTNNKQSSSCGHDSISSPTHIFDATDVATNERNIDECIANSPPPSLELTRSYELTRSHDELSRSHEFSKSLELTRSHELSRSYELSRSHDELSRSSHDSDPDFGTGQFVREVGIRRRSSLEIAKKSLSPQRWVWLPSNIVITMVTGRRN